MAGNGRVADCRAGGGAGLTGVLVLPRVDAQAGGGVSQLGLIVLDGGRDHRMAGVEVAVREVISHARDLPPRNPRVGGGDVGWGEGFDGFADLEQPDPDGVEDQPVAEVAAFEVGGDSGVGLGDIGQPQRRDRLRDSVQGTVRLEHCDTRTGSEHGAPTNHRVCCAKWDVQMKSLLEWTSLGAGPKVAGQDVDDGQRSAVPAGALAELEAVMI